MSTYAIMNVSRSTNIRAIARSRDAPRIGRRSLNGFIREMAALCGLVAGRPLRRLKLVQSRSSRTVQAPPVEQSKRRPSNNASGYILTDVRRTSAWLCSRCSSISVTCFLFREFAFYVIARFIWYPVSEQNLSRQTSLPASIAPFVRYTFAIFRVLPDS